MPTDQTLEHIPTAALLPYARNSRTHSPAQIAQLVSSINAFGWTNPVLIDADNGIIAGHGRVLAAQQAGIARVPCLRLSHLTDAQKRAYIIADNKLAENAGWDHDVLKSEMESLLAIDFDMDLIGFNAKELDDLLDLPKETTGDPDEIPDPPQRPVSRLGDLWIMGNHRLLCGDSTDPVAVDRLMNGQRAAMLHADPPYGMGKQSEGVENDNLTGAKLNSFQMAWWTAFRPHLNDNASAYIWGNSPRLWSLWHEGGLSASETLHFCNHLVWNKKTSPEMTKEDSLQYPTVTEHCLFFKRGNQFVGNVNSEHFPDALLSLLEYLQGEAAAVSLSPAQCRQITGTQMFSHWFSKSQFALISENHYAALSAHYPGHFTRPWSSLKAEFRRFSPTIRDTIHALQDNIRSYFDNSHAIMSDVIECNRVANTDRHGHPTPKPMEIMERFLRSSLPDNGLCAEPFAGSGTTLMAAHTTGRTCYSMELLPAWCDVIVKRWQTFTGKQAIRASDGAPFNACQPTESAAP